MKYPGLFQRLACGDWAYHWWQSINGDICLRYSWKTGGYSDYRETTEIPDYHLNKFSIDNMETSAGGDRYSLLRRKDKVVYYVIGWGLVL